VLPENLLKFYIQFSAPMSRGHIYDHISLRDSAGKTVELPFLEIDEELWNPQMTRLTLFMIQGGLSVGSNPWRKSDLCWKTGKHYALIIDGRLAGLLRQTAEGRHTEVLSRRTAGP